MQIAAGKERRDSLARSREEACAELALVEKDVVLLHAKMRDTRQCDEEDGRSVLTLEAQMRRIEAGRESELLALKDTLKTLTGKRGLESALRKREQLFNNLISFLKQRASNPTETRGGSNPTERVPSRVDCIAAVRVLMLLSQAVLFFSRQQYRGFWRTASNKLHRKILVARHASARGARPSSFLERGSKLRRLPCESRRAPSSECTLPVGVKFRALGEFSCGFPLLLDARSSQRTQMRR